jgi:hypothetical protein
MVPVTCEIITIEDARDFGSWRLRLCGLRQVLLGSTPIQHFCFCCRLPCPILSAFFCGKGGIPMNFGSTPFPKDEYHVCSGNPAKGIEALWFCNRARPGYPLGRVPQNATKQRWSLQAAEKLDLEGVLVLSGGRRGFQPPYNANKSTGAFRPGGVFSANYTEFLSFSATCLPPAGSFLSTTTVFLFAPCPMPEQA